MPQSATVESVVHEYFYPDDERRSAIRSRMKGNQAEISMSSKWTFRYAASRCLSGANSKLVLKILLNPFTRLPILPPKDRSGVVLPDR